MTTPDPTPEKKPKAPPPPWRTQPPADAPQVDLARWLLSLAPAAVEALWRTGEAEVAIRWGDVAGGEAVLEWRTRAADPAVTPAPWAAWTKLTPMLKMDRARALQLVDVGCASRPGPNPGGFRLSLDLARVGRAAGIR